jgi:hypothetical protein
MQAEIGKGRALLHTAHHVITSHAIQRFVPARRLAISDASMTAPDI